MTNGCGFRTGLLKAVCISVLAPMACMAAPPGRVCSKVVLTGQVAAGQEWKAAFGQGWVFRMLPIRTANAGAAGVAGWDLVVDLEQGAGYPDALLLATPPYNSISEREVGTTYGLRAQDAIGWNPRTFHFLTDPAALRRGQQLFRKLNEQSAPAQSATGQDAQKSNAIASLTRDLMSLEGHSSEGEFRILDAKLAPGDSDAAQYAENWALKSVKTPHTFEKPAGGKATALGQINWLQFTVKLYLPSSWKTPPGISAVNSACGD